MKKLLCTAMLAAAAVMALWMAGAIYAFALSDGMQAMGSMWPMQVVIGAACLFFIWYARMMSKKGVLR